MHGREGGSGLGGGRWKLETEPGALCWIGSRQEWTRRTEIKEGWGASRGNTRRQRWAVGGEDGLGGERAGRGLRARVMVLPDWQRCGGAGALVLGVDKSEYAKDAKSFAIPLA